MSHLSLPRIHFQGAFIVNPGTGNNEDSVQPTINKGGHVEINFEALENFRVTEANFRRHMENPGPLQGLWNYYGDNDCYFDNATVTSVEIGGPNKGKATLLSSEEDSLIGARVGLNDAVMVDVNSHSSNGPQIFADEFAIESDTLLCAGQPTTAYVRWYNFQRNQSLRGFPAHSAVFQFSLPKSEAAFKINSGINGRSSQTLIALNEAMEDSEVQGLTVRMCMYFVLPSFGPKLNMREREQQLAMRFAKGHKLENPAIGRVVGTVGLWRKGELASVTMGRLLNNRWNQQSSCGPATAVVDYERQVVVLDLANTFPEKLRLATLFPEKDAELEKVDWGTVTLVLKQGQTEFEVGTVDYDYSAYKLSSGVTEVSYDYELTDRLKTGLLALRSSKLALPILAEAPYMIDSDDKCVYMHEGERLDLNIHVKHLGRDSQSQVTLDVIYSKDVSTTEYVALDTLKYCGYEVKEKPVVQVQGAQPLTVTPGQPATLTVQATGVGAALIFCRADKTQPINSSLDFYICVRVLPDDSELGQVSEEKLTFDLVYKKVLRYYHLLHPAMSHVFDISKEENWTPRWAHRVLKRIDPALKNRYSYMPRTRDMSDGRRTLLQRWCQHVIMTRKDKDTFNNPHTK